MLVSPETRARLEQLGATVRASTPEEFARHIAAEMELWGSEAVARVAPDGCTLLAGISTLTINPFVHKSMPYDAVKDFAPILMHSPKIRMMVGTPEVSQLK